MGYDTNINEHDIFGRSRMLIGDDGMDRLGRSTVAVFGLGGVGSYAAEALARGGIGHIVLIDSDKIAVSNINRQLAALTSTVGRYKTEVMAGRIRDINPYARVREFPVFYDGVSAPDFDMSGWSYIIDAIDTVTAKLLLAENAAASGVPLISCMGTGNKLNPSMLEVADIYKTSICPLARVMRCELRKRGITSLKTVYSREKPISPSGCEEFPAAGRRQIPGSVSFVPPVAGMLMAGEVIRGLISD